MKSKITKIIESINKEFIDLSEDIFNDSANADIEGMKKSFLIKLKLLRWYLTKVNLDHLFLGYKKVL